MIEFKGLTRLTNHDSRLVGQLVNTVTTTNIAGRKIYLGETNKENMINQHKKALLNSAETKTHKV
jgi:hypothetical protein